MPEPNPINEPNVVTSADKKYYAGKERSVIQRSSQEKQHPPKPIPTPPSVDPYRRTAHDALRSADEYYANGGVSTRSPMSPARPSGAGVAMSVQDGSSLGPIQIKLAAELRDGMERAVEAAKAGHTRIRVALGHKGLIAHARQAVEMAVTREEITEDQGREIQIGMMRQAVAVLATDADEGVERGTGGAAADREQAKFREGLAQQDGQPIKAGDDPTASLGLDVDPAQFVYGEAETCAEPDHSVDCPRGEPGPAGPPAVEQPEPDMDPAEDFVVKDAEANPESGELSDEEMERMGL